MRPAFANALYYPTIDIRDTNWLKTSVLFWDSISTIVPESLNQPYEQPDTQYLADIGFLRPLHVNSYDKSVVGIEEDILNLLFSAEFRRNLRSQRTNRTHRKYGGIWNSKMSYMVRNRVQECLEHFSDMGLYNEKMSWRIREELQKLQYGCNDEMIYYLNEEFTSVYMTVLANRLCEDHSLGMVTDSIPCFDMGNTAKYANQTAVLPEDRFRHSRPKDHQLEQGLLLDFVIRGLAISPDAALTDVIAFKEHHKDELGRFRTQLARLTQDFTGDKPVDIMRQEISDLYNNDFLPAFNDFKAALSGFRIKWLTDTFLKVFLLFVGTTKSELLLGIPEKQALLTGAGVSVVASAASYNIDKKRFLQENPYSYLLSIGREWS